MEAEDAVRRVRVFWEALEARDWSLVQGFLHEDVVVDWPQSRERIRGRAHWMELNRNYPGDWHLRVERVVAAGDGVVSVVRAEVDGSVEYATSFFTLRDGRITGVTEYWAAEYAAPAWRAQWVESLPEE